MAIVGFSLQHPYHLIMNIAGDLSAISTISQLFHLSAPKIIPGISIVSGFGRMALGFATRAQIESSNSEQLKKANLFIIRGFLEFSGFGVILLIVDIVVTLFPQCRERYRQPNGYDADISINNE